MKSLYYLISTLPSLKFGEKSPFSEEKFVSLCAACLDRDGVELLRSVRLEPPLPALAGKNATARKWSEWDTCLRNRIIRMRRPCFNAEPAAFQKPETDYFSEIDRLVQEAFSASDPMTREKSIDGARWRKLDDLECGHIFDFEKLVVYKLKLQLLEKWSSRKAEQGRACFERLASSGIPEQYRLL